MAEPVTGPAGGEAFRPPAPQPPRSAEVQLSPTPASVGAARRFVTDALAGWGAAEQAEVAALLTSELVTNALLHARSGTRLVLTLEDDQGLRVDVHDDSPRLPRRQRYRDLASTGRGVVLLDALADRWGAEPARDGKRVWFVLAPPPDPTAGGTQG
ncbi:MAG TPA: ATP-binding protein [Acidimicrobiales bacterium]|nr:ATP-binding protein [Acidimicrobiales bacterium]